MSVWCPMMIGILFVDEWVILATTVSMCSVMTVMNHATLHRTAPTRILPHEHYTTKTDLIQVMDIPTPKGTDYTQPIMVQDIGDISQSCHHSHHNRSSRFRRHTMCSSSSQCSSLCCPSTDGHPITICTKIYPTSIVALHSGLTTSFNNITCSTILQTRAAHTPVKPTALHGKHSQEKPV